MDRHKLQYCVPRVGEGIEEAPLLDLTSGYVQRAVDRFPKQGSKSPWRLYQNYIIDKLLFQYAPLRDKTLEFG